MADIVDKLYTDTKELKDFINTNVTSKSWLEEKQNLISIFSKINTTLTDLQKSLNIDTTKDYIPNNNVKFTSYYSDVYDPTKTLQDYINACVEMIGDIDNNVDMASGTPMACIVKTLALAIEAVGEISQAVYNEMSPATASLQGLINIYGMLYGIEYKQGSKTQQTIQIVVTEPCTIYCENTTDNTQFQISDNNGNIYVPTQNVTFEKAGTYDVEFEASEYGEIFSDINTITNILTTTLGIQEVNNITTYSSIGSDIETEASYRERILQASRFYNQTGTTQTTEDALLNLGCKDAFIRKNLSNQEADGVSAGSTAIIVDSSDTEAMQQSIAKLLSSSFASANLFTFGNVIDPTGNGVDYSYFNTRILTANATNFLKISNGVLQIQCNNQNYTLTGLDFTSCANLSSVINVVVNALKEQYSGVFTATNNDNTMLKCTEIQIGTEQEIKIVPYTGTETDITDLSGSLYFDYNRQEIVKSTKRINVSRNIQIAENRYTSTISYNEAFSVQVDLKFDFYCSKLQDGAIDIMKQQLALQFQDKGYLKINQSLNVLQVSNILNEVLEENNITGFPSNVLFKAHYQDDTQWKTNFKCEYIYEIPSLSHENISINVIYQ